MIVNRNSGCLVWFGLMFFIWCSILTIHQTKAQNEDDQMEGTSIMATTMVPNQISRISDFRNIPAKQNDDEEEDEPSILENDDKGRTFEIRKKQTVNPNSNANFPMVSETIEEDVDPENNMTAVSKSNKAISIKPPKSNPFLSSSIMLEKSPKTPSTNISSNVPSRRSKLSKNLNRFASVSKPTVSESDTDVVSKKVIAKKPPLMLKKIHDYLIVVLLVAVMFAMGCSITWSQVWGHVCSPINVIIGLISQFILLPFSAFCLIEVFNIEPLYATGLLILACSPGGVTSNVFTYFCEGDLSLSVTMTSFSTVVALFMMPFNIWLYGRKLETESLVIPYSKMTVSLLTLTTPVAVGMVVNWKLPKVAPILTQIGSISGFAIIIVCQTLEVFIFPDIFNDVPGVLYVAEFLLPILGLTLGFGAASMLGLSYSARRTIAIEAGIQNVGTALTIITLSFPFEQLRKVWLFPFLYAFSMLAVCCVLAVLYKLQKRLASKTKSLDIMKEHYDLADAVYQSKNKSNQQTQINNRPNSMAIVARQNRV